MSFLYSSGMSGLLRLFNFSSSAFERSSSFECPWPTRPALSTICWPSLDMVNLMKSRANGLAFEGR